MDVLMPQLGETVTEGKITTWFKSIGDPVKPGENLFEIETDKVSMEIQAIAGGVLAEIRVPAGDVASVGAVVAIISDAAGAKTVSAPAAAAAPRAASARIPAARSTVPVPEQPPGAKSRPVALDPFFEVRTPERNYGPARLADGTTATPLARRLAAEAGLDLSRISGSGPHGRTFARDVEGAIGSGTSKAALVPAPAVGASAEQVKALYRDTPYEEIPLDGMRRIIAQRLTLAKQTVPHFYLTADVEIDQLIKLREEANAAAPRDKDAKPAFKLSVNDIVIKAWAAALQRVPIANAVWAEDRILRFRHSDIGVAVAIEGGLFTPVIRKAETKTLAAISTEMQDLAARARDAPAQAARISGRLISDFQPRHVRHPRILGDHQSAARDHPGGGRHAAASRGEGEWRRCLRKCDDGDAVLRSPRGRRRCRRGTDSPPSGN